MDRERAQTRSAFIAVIGAPNAGKSTLVNQLMGTKISIVTHKAQTTRYAVRAIYSKDDTQLVFIDTPGIFAAKGLFERSLVAAAWRNMRQADLLMVIIDAARALSAGQIIWLERASRLSQPKILVLNKIDLIAKEQLLFLIDKVNSHLKAESVFLLSALTGSGCADLLSYLCKSAPYGAWHFPGEQISDMAPSQMASEITREQLFLRLHQEIPYALMVETEEWRQNHDGSLTIRQIIYVERPAHKPIIIGKGGMVLKNIGQKARQEMQKIWHRKVHLFLFVKVKSDWRDDKLG